jgi:hypothetical protein
MAMMVVVVWCGGGEEDENDDKLQTIYKQYVIDLGVYKYIRDMLVKTQQ